MIGAGGSVGRRLAAILPHGIITVLWLGGYLWLGYGTYGSGVYINPMDEPFRYLGGIPERMVASAGVLFGGVPADLWMATSFRPSMVVAGVVTLAVVVPLAHGSLRGLQPEERKNVYWLLVGMAGALMPQMAGLLGSRSYLLPSVGGSALLAVILHRWWTFARKMPGLQAQVVGRCRCAPGRDPPAGRRRLLVCLDRDLQQHVCAKRSDRVRHRA